MLSWHLPALCPLRYHRATTALMMAHYSTQYRTQLVKTRHSIDNGSMSGDQGINSLFEVRIRVLLADREGSRMIAPTLNAPHIFYRTIR